MLWCSAHFFSALKHAIREIVLFSVFNVVNAKCMENGNVLMSQVSITNSTYLLLVKHVHPDHL